MFATHQHYNVLHVVVLLWVKKGCELLLVCFHILVLVSHFESPLITSHHLPIAEAIIRVRVICKSEVESRLYTLCVSVANQICDCVHAVGS